MEVFRSDLRGAFRVTRLTTGLESDSIKSNERVWNVDCMTGDGWLGVKFGKIIPNFKYYPH